MPNNQVEGGPSSRQRQSLEAERRANAQIIVDVGRQMGASDRDILIGLMTAMQESSLRNLNYGDRDSLGLFQQRPSQGWGSPSQIMNPRYAAKKFFDELLKVPNRNSMSLTQAAQRVQRSAYPNAYAKHENYARSLLTVLSNGTGGAPAGVPEALRQDTRTPTSGTVAPGTQEGAGAFDEWQDETEKAQQALLGGDWNKPADAPAGASAAPAPPPTRLGSDDPEDATFESGPLMDVMPDGAAPAVTQTADTPVGNPFTIPEIDFDTYERTFGASRSSDRNALPKSNDIINYAKQFIGVPYKWGGTSPLGFDCSGLIQYVYKQMGVNLPRVSYQQAAAGTPVRFSEAKAGDLVWWDSSSRNNGADHIAIYLGNNQILEAYATGYPVRIRKLDDDDIRSAGVTRVL